ncbi:replication initiation protein [Klebsiella pneumoniae]
MKPVKTKVEVLQADMDIIDAKAELVPALPKPRGRKPRKIETPPENTELRKGKFAVHCVADWSAVERKVINVLIWNAFDDLLTTRTHEISMPLLMVLIDWPASKNVTGLRQYLLNMSKTVVEWDAWNQFGTEFKGPAWSTTSMLPHAEITDGMVKYEFTEALAKKLHNPAMYAAINLKVNRVLEGKYSLTLYENIVSYSDLPHGSSGTKPLMEWRRVLNALTKTYDEYKHFKARVIDPSIQEINLKSNITVQLVD